MSHYVAGYLTRGRAAGPHVSALDAVMGEDWAIVEPGRARQGHRSRLGLRAAHQANVARMAGGGLPGRKPQAVVKMIRKGGASDLRGFRAQMAYLSRQGAQPLQRSEAMMGIEVDAEQATLLEKDWRMPAEGSGRSDRTSHFIASFPEHTDPRAAERAGREWAEEMFGSGRYGGDSYDYYTAFHTDRAHPHMHVIVYRRGLEQGEWLKVSQRSDMNYDRMRKLLADVAAREGIELEATPRLARGLHDRPVPDAEYRRARREERMPVPPGHTRVTAILAAAALLHQSRRFATEAQLVESRSPETARVLYAASAAASEGKALAEITARISDRQEADITDRVEAAKAEIRDNIGKMDLGLEHVGDSATRMKLAREIAGLKAETAPLLGTTHDLAAFTQAGESGWYRGIDRASPPRDVAHKTMADDQARDVAKRYGVDPEATVERYSGPPPSKGLERQFAQAEVAERQRSRAARGEGPEDVDARHQALTRMHRELGEIYDAARSRDRGAETFRHVTPPAGETLTRAFPRQQPVQAARQDHEQNPIYRQVMAEKATETRAAAARDDARRVQERADAERSRRERDDGRGL